jgi:hypothetical protein
MFASAIALTTAGMVTLNKNLKKNRELTNQSGVERRLNESALQSVTQLVSNGRLHFNNECNRLEPTQPNSGYNFPTSGCAVISTNESIDCSKSNNSGWIYLAGPGTTDVTIGVCVSSTERIKGALVTNNKRVNVTITGYETVTENNGVANQSNGVTRRFARAKSQPEGRNASSAYYGSLRGKISLGLTDGNTGLLAKYGGADTCFYMRPQTNKQTRGSANNLSFSARNGGGTYSIQQLEPRPEGPNADEFQQAFEVGTKSPESYEVLSKLRNELIDKYYKATPNPLRGSRPETTNWSLDPLAWTPDATPQSRMKYMTKVITETSYLQQQGVHFLGVMPRPKDPNKPGPNFQYFLAATPGSSDHLQEQIYNKDFDPKYMEWYEQGCKTSIGDSKAAFCTKVDIPHKSYSANFSTKCKIVKQGLDPVAADKPKTVAYANRALLTSCNAAWVDLVANYARSNDSTSLNGYIKTSSTEISARMVVEALEVDDTFLNRQGQWASPHPLRDAYDKFGATLLAELNAQSVGASIKDDFTIAFESDQDSSVTAKTGVIREWKIWALDPLPSGGTSQIEHISNTCAYFKYYNPENPKTCAISFITEEKNGFVCRNNDGCFDELTKIRMANGVDRLITELKTGDLVWNPVTSAPAKIAKMVIGPENKPLIHVTIGKSTVRVTDSHPFMTDKGWVMAKNLKVGANIRSGQKTFLPVTKIELGPTGRTVVNIALEGSADQHEMHYLLADGVVTGDLVIQNMLQSRASSTGSTQR